MLRKKKCRVPSNKKNSATFVIEMRTAELVLFTCFNLPFLRSACSRERWLKSRAFSPWKPSYIEVPNPLSKSPKPKLPNSKAKVHFNQVKDQSQMPTLWTQWCTWIDTGFKCVGARFTYNHGKHFFSNVKIYFICCAVSNFHTANQQKFMNFVLIDLGTSWCDRTIHASRQAMKTPRIQCQMLIGAPFI